MAAAEPRGWFARASGWVQHHAPTRESIEANRFLRPVAHRILVPALWRFNRRSVPRGVALGLFAGILFPFPHMALAAVFSLPLRANVPTAVATTLVNNPVTFLPIMATAYRIGNWVLELDRAVPGEPIANNVKANAGLLHWVVAQGGPATIIGLLLMAITLSAIGYFATSLIWRWRTGGKWRNRRN
ncbi:MAG: DUF2062 domain-containing protein [Sphingomonas bacterium]